MAVATPQTEGPNGLFPPSQLSPRTVLVACVTAVAVAVALWALWNAPFALAVTIIGALVASALEHGVRWLQGKGVRRGFAIAIVMLLVVALIAGVGIVLIPPMVNQISALVDQAPQLAQQLKSSPLYQHLDARFHVGHQLGSLRLPQIAEQLAQNALLILRDVFGIVAWFVTLLFVTLFMLIYGGGVVQRTLSEAIPARRPRYERIAVNVYDSLGRYIAGLIAVMFLNFAFTSAFLAILGMPYNLALGMFSGLGSLVPVIGALSAGVLLTGVALIAGGVWKALFVLGYYLVYQQIENHVWAPLIYKRTVRLDPLVSIIGVLFFTELGGIAAAFVAVPVIAAAKVVLHEVLEVRRQRLAPDPRTRIPPEEPPAPQQT